MSYLRKPEWLKIAKGAPRCGHVNEILVRHHLNTVCEQAGCPNRGECYKSGTATFMLLGKNCTRNCRFCKVTKDSPEQLDPHEPLNVAKAVAEMQISHAVITSVTRDDLEDGGAEHFAKTILAIRELSPSTTIEVLIPDFEGNEQALRLVVNAKPEIINHNVETVPALYPDVRPMAIFNRSLELLGLVKKIDDSIITKSGLMVGLGETATQVAELLHSLRSVNCDIVTIGQYLQPSKEHLQLVEYIRPDQFKKYEELAYKLGFKYVASGPLVRSSYHAGDGLHAMLLAARQ
ncbi:MAG: lipoyl synthase [Clostridia bacterium]